MNGTGVARLWPGVFAPFRGGYNRVAVGRHREPERLGFGSPGQRPGTRFNMNAGSPVRAT
jgi:hypothetical protein